MKELRNKLAIILTICMVLSCTQPAWADVDIDYLTPDMTQSQQEYVEGNVIVCVKGGAAALNNALSGNDSGRLKMVRRTREYTVEDVLASFEAEDDTEYSEEPEQPAVSEEKTEQERPKLFGAFNAAPDASENTEEILLLHTDDTETLIAKLSGLSCVKYAQPDYICYQETLGGASGSYDDGKNEEFYFAQRHLNNADGSSDIDAEEAWSIDTPAEEEDEQVIAVMDTGVNYTHPDLMDVMWDKGEEYGELTALGGGAHGINTSGEGEAYDPDDIYSGHGTHCASIIAGAWNGVGVAGVNANTKIMACRWMSSSGGATSSYLKAAGYVIKAKAVGVNVTLANNSWGMKSKFFYQSPAIYDMVNRMSQAGIVNVFAAGNESLNLDGYPQNAHLTTDMTLLVGAADSEGECAVFSNYGYRTVDVMAPGVNILAAASLNPGVTEIPAKYYPWLDDSYNIFFNDMENNDEIRIKIVPAEALLPEDEIEMDGIISGDETLNDEILSDEILDDEILSDETPDEATPSNATPSNAAPNEATPSNAEPSGGRDVLPELATPSTATKKLYGDTDNKVLKFDTDYVKGKKNAFDIEFSLSEEQRQKIYETSDIHIAFQISRDGEGLSPSHINTEVLIWNNACGEWESAASTSAIFVDSGWNQVSFAVKKDYYPDLLDEDNRMYIRIIDDQKSEVSKSTAFYIDNVGIGTAPSQYAYSSGTSMACPCAVGVLSLIIDRLKSADDAAGKSDIDIAKEAVAYLKGGVEKSDALNDKCISSGIINAGNSLSRNVSPVVNEIEDQGNGSSLIRGYFFGSETGSVTIGGNPAAVQSWSDREILVKNISAAKSRAEIKVTSSSGKSGRMYADYGAGRGGYEELTPLPVNASETRICAAGDTILCLACEPADSDEKIVRAWKYDITKDTWSRVDIPGGDIKLYFGVQYEISMAAGETEIYVLTTANESTSGKTEERILTYDTLTGTWKHDVTLEMPANSIPTGMLCISDGGLVLLGTEEESPKIKKIYPDTGEVYEELGKMPQRYVGGCSFRVGDSILAAGTYNGMVMIIFDIMLPGIGKVNELAGYDIKTGEWKESNAAFFGESSDWLDNDTWRQCAAVPLKDGMMIVGPVKNNGESNMSDTWIYKASEDTYEAYPALFNTTRTNNVSACLLGGKMYVLGVSQFAENKNMIKFSCLDISELAAAGYPNVKKSGKPDPKPDPDPKPKKNRSSNLGTLWSDKPVKTGTPQDPVSNGIWTIDSDGVWYYHTNAYFRNTWGYIVNPYAAEGQHEADWFWFDINGKMLTGWQFINGKWYYLNPVRDNTYGACLLGPGKTPDGYEIDETGAYIGN